MNLTVECVKIIREYYVPLLVLILGSIWYKINKKDRNAIPGPKPWPLVGNALQVGLKPYITFMQWEKQYGPIMYLNLVKERMVVLSDPVIIKELFNNPLTTGRETATNPVIYEMCQGPNGIMNADGDTWETQRKFTIRTLREFGFERESVEGIIVTEVNALINWLKQTEGIPITGNNLLIGPFVNVIWAMVSSDRCDWTDKEEAGAVKQVEKFLRSFQKVIDSGLYFAPFLRYIFPDRTGFTTYTKDIAGLTKIFKETVQRHKDTLDKSNPRDLIDCYLKEIEETDDKNSSFYDTTGYRNLLGVLFDLFMAGSTTVSSAMTWFLLCISDNQEVQDKIGEEIDQIVGPSRSPSLSDRKSMPYTEAVIMETLRFGSVTPMGAPHRTTEDIYYKGYLIKKDITIIANLYGINYDKDVWRDPENFRPERFMGIEGAVGHNGAETVMFSDGKRKCLGERLARDELFLFITGLIQTFKIIPEDEKIPANYESETGLFMREPKPFKIVFKVK